MLNITQTIDNETGDTWYAFTNRGVDYSITNNGLNDDIAIWSTRKSLGIPNVRVMTKDEMRNGPKVFRDFIDFIEMDGVTA